MKSTLLLCAFASLFFIACKKNNNSNSPMTSLTKFIRTDTLGYKDTSSVTFDANGLINTWQGTTTWFLLSITRNTAGIITSYSHQVAQGPVYCTITSVVYSDPLSDHYTYQIKDVPCASHYRDSIVYTYSGTNITSYIDYNIIGAIDSAKHTFSYDAAGNLLVATYLDHDGSGAWSVLNMSYTYSYDNKTNPLNFRSEGILFDYIENVGPNNITSETWNYPGNILFYETRSYTYNQNNQPLSLTASRTPGTVEYSQVYIY